MKIKAAWNIVRSFFSLKHYLTSWAKLALVSEATSGFCAVLLSYFGKFENSLFFMFLCVASMGMAVAFSIVGMRMESLEKLTKECKE